MRKLGQFHLWEHIFSSFWRLLAPAPSARRNVETPNFRHRAIFQVHTSVPNFSQFGSVVFSNLCGHRTGDEGRGTTENFITTRTHNFFKLDRFFYFFFTQHVFHRYLALSFFKFRKMVLFEDFCGLKAENGCAMAKPNTTHTQRFALRAIEWSLILSNVHIYFDVLSERCSRSNEISRRFWQRFGQRLLT